MNQLSSVLPNTSQLPVEGFITIQVRALVQSLHIRSSQNISVDDLGSITDMSSWLEGLIQFFKLDTFADLPEWEKDSFIDGKIRIFGSYLGDILESRCELLMQEKYSSVIAGRLSQALEKSAISTMGTPMSTRDLQKHNTTLGSVSLMAVLNQEHGKIWGVILLRLLSALVTIYHGLVAHENRKPSPQRLTQIRALSRIIMGGYVQRVKREQAVIKEGIPLKPTPLRLLNMGAAGLRELLTPYTEERLIIQCYQALVTFLESNIKSPNTFSYETLKSSIEVEGEKGFLWNFKVPDHLNMTFHSGSGCMSTLRGWNITAGRSALREADIANTKISVEEEILDWLFLHRITPNFKDLPFQEARIYNVEANSPIVGCFWAVVTASFNRRAWNTTWFVPYSSSLWKATIFDYSLLNSVHKWQFGQAVFTEESGKWSSFFLQWENSITAHGDRTLEWAVIFLDEKSVSNFQIHIGRGAAKWLIILTPQILSDDQIEHLEGGEQPVILHPNIQGVLYQESLTALVKNMYQRFPYIRAQFVPLFTRIRSDVELIQDLRKSATYSKDFPTIIEDSLSVSLYFWSLNSSDKERIVEILSYILAQEDALDTSVITNPEYCLRVEKTIESDIQRQRLEALEKVVLGNIGISSEILNLKLGRFFNSFNISAIQDDPVLGEKFALLTPHAKHQLSAYLEELNKSNAITKSIDWEIFITTFNFLRSMKMNLPVTLYPSRLLFPPVVPSKNT